MNHQTISKETLRDYSYGGGASYLDTAHFFDAQDKRPAIERLPEALDGTSWELWNVGVYPPVDGNDSGGDLPDVIFREPKKKAIVELNGGQLVGTNYTVSDNFRLVTPHDACQALDNAIARAGKHGFTTDTISQMGIIRGSSGRGEAFYCTLDMDGWQVADGEAHAAQMFLDIPMNPRRATGMSMLYTRMGCTNIYNDMRSKASEVHKFGHTAETVKYLEDYIYAILARAYKQHEALQGTFAQMAMHVFVDDAQVMKMIEASIKRPAKARVTSVAEVNEKNEKRYEMDYATWLSKVKNVTDMFDGTVDMRGGMHSSVTGTAYHLFQAISEEAIWSNVKNINAQWHSALGGSRQSVVRDAYKFIQKEMVTGNMQRVYA